MKTIHPIPPAGSEEALIRALETLLAQENPDEARLQALLDQLDRQTGAAPLDPEAGWADLQRRRSARPKRRGLRRFPLALAAVLVCLAVSGTALAVNFGLHEKLADLFQVNESNQTLVADAIDTADGIHVPLAEDTIVLEWPLQKSNRTRTFDLNQTLIVEGQQPGILKGLSLSPISLNLYTSHLHLDTDTLTLSLVFQDGTTVPVDNPSGEIYSGSTLEDTWASFHYTFHTPIDPAQVTAVQIGDQTFPLP